MSKESRMQIYHEKQHLQFCAVHAINNLFQDPAVCNKERLNEVCYNLNSNRFNNPHKSMVGLGNYDINVITAFLQTLGYDIIWFDKRKSPHGIKIDEVFGFLLNSISKQSVLGKTFSLGSNFKHWYTVRKLKNDLYFNLDSKLKKPVNIGNDKKFVEFLENKLEEESCQLLLVVKSGKTRNEIYNKEEENAESKKLENQ